MEANPGAPGSVPEIPPDEPFYTIGQVASLLSVQPAALRRLDDLDVVSPGRSSGGQRRYSSNDVDLIRKVMVLMEEGVTLPGVRRVLELRGRVEYLEAQLAAARAQLDEQG